MYVATNPILNLRWALLGVFCCLGLSAASASSRDTPKDTHISKQVEAFTGKKCLRSLFPDHQGSGPAVGLRSNLEEKAPFSIARLRYEETMASLWHGHYQEIHLSFRTSLLRIILLKRSAHREICAIDRIP